MFNAVQFCKDYHIPYKLQGKNVSSGWIGVQCPFCRDKSNHGGINQENGNYSCWKCGFDDMAVYIQYVTGKTFQEALQIKRTYTNNFNVHYYENKTNCITKIELPGEELQQMHKNYLIGRGFNPDYIRNKYKIKGTGITGYWRYRIIIPIFHNEEIISFVGRDITDRQSEKYLILSKKEGVINPKHTLYGLEFCRNRNWVCIVEGVFDVWRMGDGFCASMGTNLTEQQIHLLLPYRHVVIMFDPEKEASEKARKAAEHIASYGNTVELLLMNGDKDPGDLSQEEAVKLRKELGL